MQALKCEMCGSTDVIRQKGLYVCQHCGTKYSVEDAKAMMSGTVDVSGSTVKIDRSDELMNLATLAGREVELGNYEKALSYFEKMLLLDAEFFPAIQGYDCVKALRFDLETFEDDMDALYSHIPLVFGNMIEQAKEDDTERAMLVTAATNAAEQYENVVNQIHMVASANKEGLETQAGIYMNALDLRCKFIFEEVANQLENEFADVPKLMDRVVELRKKSIEHYAACIKAIVDAKVRQEHLEKYKVEVENMKRYDPNYVAPKVGSCYIATAVYGSYDCAEVWTLRRFRDEFLAKHVLGRAFIKGYYTVSPRLVEHCKDCASIQVMGRNLLNRFVYLLQGVGFDGSSYEDNV